MLAVHRIFQMIFGIIVSFTVLYFLISFSGSWAGGQKNLQRGEILKAFADEARQVYLTGIPTNFTYFSRYSDLQACYISAPQKGEPQMSCLKSEAPQIPVDTPVLFSPGNQVYVGRDSLDYGWYTFNAVEAMPDTVFVFNPSQASDWDLIRTIVGHTPDTSDKWSVIKVQFAFCDGPEVLKVCGGQFCGKDEFLSILGSGQAGMALCSAKLMAGMKLLTVSQSCSSSLPERDVCISPANSNGVGNAFVQGSAKAYVWKDPMDLIALGMGGSDKDEFGKTLGEKIYAYKNSVLMERLSTASEIISRRELLASSSLPSTDETGCRDAYTQLSQTLQGLSSLTDYSDVAKMNTLNEKLYGAKQLYQQLVEKGCERSSYAA